MQCDEVKMSQAQLPLSDWVVVFDSTVWSLWPFLEMDQKMKDENKTLYHLIEQFDIQSHQTQVPTLWRSVAGVEHS